MPVVRTGTWHGKLAESAGRMQVHLVCRWSGQGPGTANWQGALGACKFTWCASRQDRDLARQTGRERWARASSLSVPVVRTGTWHGKLAGSAGRVQVHLVCQSSGQGPGTANWQGALDACKSTWSAGWLCAGPCGPPVIRIVLGLHGMTCKFRLTEGCQVPACNVQDRLEIDFLNLSYTPLSTGNLVFGPVAGECIMQPSALLHHPSVPH